MGKEQELLEACQSGKVDIVEKLISSKQKRSAPNLLSSFRRSTLITCRDASGYSPLHYAALNGHRQIVSYLLAAEADLLAKDKKGCIPLHLAAFSGQKEIVQMLLAHDVSRQSVNAQNFAKEIPLHFAAQFNHCSVVNILLQHGADPSLRNSFGDNALDLACRFGRLDAVRLLVSIRPQLVHASSGLDANGGQPPVSSLHLAAAKGNPEVVRLLLNAGFDPNYATADGTALHTAAFFRRLDVAKLLIANGVDTSIRNSNGKTALDLLYEHQANKTHEITNLIQSSAAWETIIDILENRLDRREMQPIPVSPTKAAYQNMSPTMQRAVWMQMPDDSYQRNEHENHPIPSANSAEDYARRPTPFLNLFETPIGSRLSTNHMYCDEHSPISIKTLPSRNSDDISILPCSCAVQEGFQSGPRVQEEFRAGSKASPPKPPRTMKYDLNGDEILQKTVGDSQNEKLSPEAPPETVGRVWESESTPETAGRVWESESTPEESAPAQFYFDRRINFDASEVELRTNGPKRNENSSTYFSVVEKFNYESKFIADSSDVGINRLTYVVGNSSEHDRSKNTEKISPKAGNRISQAGDFMEESFDEKSVKAENRISRTSELLQEERLEESPVADELEKRSAPIAKAESVYLDDSLGELANTRSLLAPKLNVRLSTPEFSPPSAWASESKIFEQMIGPLEKNKSQSVTLQKIEVQANRGNKNEIRSRDADTNTDDRYGSEYSQCSRSSSHTESTECCCVGEYELGGLEAPLHIISDHDESTLKDDASPQPDLSLQDAITFVDENAEDVGKDPSPPLDEQAEWEKINSIVDSFLPGISSSQFSTLSTAESGTGPDSWTGAESGTGPDSGTGPESGTGAESGTGPESWTGPEDETAAGLNDPMGFWLAERDLAHLYLILKNAGVYELRDLALLERNDLEALYLDAIDIDLFLKIQNSLEFPNEEAKAARHRFVSDWLLALDLGDYVGAFMRQGLDTMQKVKQISNLAQLKRLGVASLGHRKRIWWSLNAKLDASTLEHRISVLKTNLEEFRTNNSRASMDLNGNFEDGRNPQGGPALESQSKSSSALQARGYSWKHRKESLIHGAISYSAHYLGSSLVDNLHGTEASKAAIEMRKKVSREIAKIPQVSLQVSHTGVRFFDIGSDRLISEHEIQDIHCVCQDERDMNCFAYITKQGDDKHLCHVFSVLTTDMAIEIILTLGQAFEVAYEEAMKLQN